MDINDLRRQARGDNAASAWNRGPEIIAQEQRILILADALLSWMQQVDWKEHAPVITDFFTNVMARNPIGPTLGNDDDDELVSRSKAWVLDKLDPDANRLFLDLLRAAWHRRSWQIRYGERVEGESL